jgi:uncharacterized membrane protein YbaN (DUF454 family)
VRESVLKGLRVAGGATLVLIGLAGLVLPIMPGWLFVIPGLVLLSADVPAIRRRLRYLERRYPWLRQMMDKVRRKRGGNGAPRDER